MVCPPADPPHLAGVIARFREVRRQTVALCQPLAIEDYQLQSMPDASPPKWHLAHTTWFFETFVLGAHPNYRPVHPLYSYLFNSYYEAVGDRWPRAHRGLLSRPTVAEVRDYRDEVDDQVTRLLEELDGPALAAVLPVIELGLNHEQQHQELILTDLKHGLSLNPLEPIYSVRTRPSTDTLSPAVTCGWHELSEGLVDLGYDGKGFAFDNEGPKHRVWLQGCRIATQPTTCGEYLAFIEAGAYDRPEFWLADGWTARLKHDWTAPLYWARQPEGWSIFTLSGSRFVNPAEPVCHLSYYEADAFARWSNARLPTEAEWETAARALDARRGTFLESGRFHPAPATAAVQFLGDCWEWTASPYTPYPRFRPAAGAVGEYNGKFMCNQMVLRGGSCVTPESHIRPTYRNFFPPDARWQFSGIRLAMDTPV